MLVVSLLRDTSKDESKGEMENFTISSEEFPDFADGILLIESIDFNNLLLGVDIEGDVLSDLEIYPEVIVELSFACGCEESKMNKLVEKTDEDDNRKKEEDKVSSSNKEDDEHKVVKPPSKDGYRGRKSSSKAKNCNNNQGTRKVKVDWTPELYRRFVQAVGQLGVDKVVPSRILKIIGINCLTRHNIVSHLKKYRSHRKHLQARETEAANWIHRRQVYGGATPASGGAKQDMNLLLPLTMGFPPMSSSTSHMQHQSHHFRPLHVWGHPTMDRSLMHLWLKHLALPLRPTWGPLPPADTVFWHHCVPNGQIPETPCFPC